MDIKKLVSTQDAFRNVEWEVEFLRALSEGQVDLVHEDPQLGPDSWPYMFLKFNETTTQEPAKKIMGWCTERGIGIAVNPDKVSPDYVLPFGMLWFFRQTGMFFIDQPEVQNGQVLVEKGAKIYSGEPSAEYLPMYVRAILREFFKQQSLDKVKVLMISTDKKHYDLCFSVESLGNPPKHEHKGIAEAISWFLPMHYSLVLMSEKDLPSFIDL